MTQVAAFSPTGSTIEEVAHAQFPSVYAAEGLMMRAFRNREDGLSTWRSSKVMLSPEPLYEFIQSA